MTTNHETTGDTMNDTDTLKARTEALHRVAAENDRLRATLARVKAIADDYAALVTAYAADGDDITPTVRADRVVNRLRAVLGESR